MSSIDSVAITLCRLLGVPNPNGANAKPLEDILSEAERVLEDKKVEKVLAYAPDAIGDVMYKSYVDDFNPVKEYAPVMVELDSVYPSKTPICFRSMFTGSQPDEDEIPHLMKREVVLKETIFDILPKHDIKVAIVAASGSSIDKIFRGRSADYFSMQYDPIVTLKVLELIRECEYDFILAYHQEYDDVSHGGDPNGILALRAFRNNIQGFNMMAEAFNRKYRNHNRAVGFFPDHGNHYDHEKKVGTHGTKKPEDMKLRHFWGIKKGNS